MIISGLCVPQQWQDKGFRSRSADAMTHAVAIVCKFYTLRCVGSVRTANFSVASWQKTTCYNWDQIAILYWITLFEKDLHLHWSGICDFYLLNCNRERSYYYKYCQCSQNFLWVKNGISHHNLWIPMYSTLFTASTGGYHMFAHLKLLLQLLGICICSFGVLIFDGWHDL